MVERHQDERIVARWIVAAADLVDFVREQRQRSKRGYVPKGLLAACDAGAQAAGIEVLLCEDAIFVGSWRVPSGFSNVEVHETWMRFIGDEGYQVDVPLPRAARAEAERIAGMYRESLARVQAAEARQFAEARAQPTLHNRLLAFVENRFAWVLLGVFFVLLPLLAVALWAFKGSLPE